MHGLRSRGVWKCKALGDDERWFGCGHFKGGGCVERVETAVETQES